MGAGLLRIQSVHLAATQNRGNCRPLRELFGLYGRQFTVQPLVVSRWQLAVSTDSKRRTGIGQEGPPNRLFGFQKRLTEKPKLGLPSRQAEWLLLEVQFGRKRARPDGPVARTSDLYGNGPAVEDGHLETDGHGHRGRH